MQSSVRRHHAAEVVVEDWQDVVADFGGSGGWKGAGPFELVAGVGPEGEVGIYVGARFLAGEQAGGGVVEARGEVGSDGVSQGVGFCVCFEAGEGFGEVEGGVEEGGVRGYFFGGGVLGIKLGFVNLDGRDFGEAVLPTGFPSSS